MRDHRRVGITIFLLVVSAAAVAVLSPSGSTDSNTVAVTSDASTPGAAGMRVYLDPETGDVTGTPDAAAVLELDQELQNALRHDDEGLVSVTHPNGAVSMDLQGRYEEASVVRIDANGKVVICTDNIANLERTITDTTPTVPEVK